MRKESEHVFQEFDERKQAKQRAEYITPKILREFIAQYVNGENVTILEPAIGSGQLLEYVKNKIKSVDGYDVSVDVCNALKNNFGSKCNFYNQSFLQSKLTKNYDYAISNYPFSLKFKDNTDDAKAVLNDDLLKQFYQKTVTGVMDFPFILKSFNVSNKGLFLCFPGIGYRNTEKKFREYLVKNNFLVEYGILEEVNFEHTSISILFMFLSKEKQNKSVKSFYKNFKTKEYEEKYVEQFDDNYTFEIPKKIAIDSFDKFDAVAEELKARKQVEDMLFKQIQFSKSIYELDEDVRQKAPSVPEWVDNICKKLKHLFTLA